MLYMTYITKRKCELQEEQRHPWVKLPRKKSDGALYCDTIQTEAGSQLAGLWLENGPACSLGVVLCRGDCPSNVAAVWTQEILKL